MEKSNIEYQALIGEIPIFKKYDDLHGQFFSDEYSYFLILDYLYYDHEPRHTFQVAGFKNEFDRNLTQIKILDNIETVRNGFNTYTHIVGGNYTTSRLYLSEIENIGILLRLKKIKQIIDKII